MLNPDQIDRYSRHLLLKEIGGQGQQKLLAAKVLIVGAGGLGAPIIQYLAAAGVGHIGIVDDDVIDLSNLQRQVIYRGDQIGAAKAERAASFAQALNPDCKTTAIKIRLDADNVEKVLGKYDLIIEGVDNFKTRFVLNAAAIAARKPLISAALGRFDGQLSVFKPYETPGVLPCYRCLTPEEPPLDAQINCAEHGVLGAVAGVVGTLAAVETIKEILDLGDSLAGALLIYDGLKAETRRVRLPADPACADCGALKDEQKES